MSLATKGLFSSETTTGLSEMNQTESVAIWALMWLVPPSLPHAQGPQTQVPLPKWPKGGVLSLLQPHCGGRPQTGKLAVDSCPLYTPIRPLAEGPHQQPSPNSSSHHLVSSFLRAPAVLAMS